MSRGQEIDALAEFIRKVDGNHSMGAGVLAEHIIEWQAAHQQAPAEQEPAACLLGIKGSAYDTPEVRRAYTYTQQPGNQKAYRLGNALRRAGDAGGRGDGIGYGLNLLKHLADEGYGVFELGTEYTAPIEQGAPQPKQSAALGRVAELEKALWKINSINDSPMRFNQEIDAVIRAALAKHGEASHD